MKIIVLTLANDEVCVCGRCINDGRKSSYTPMVKSVRETWSAADVDGVKVYYIYGHRKGIDFPNDSENIITTEKYWPDGGAEDGFEPKIVKSKRHPFAIEDCIYSDTPEGRENIYYKTIDAFEWLLKNEDFDYILRTNCGTYVDLQLLKDSLNNIGVMDDVYGGNPNVYDNRHNPHQPPQIKFASGAAFLVSRNLVKDLIENRETVDLVCSPYASKCVGDDVTFAKRFLYEKNANYLFWEKQDIWEMSQIPHLDENKIQYYFRHTINPELMYAVHDMRKKKRVNNK